jgi:hypothetical protein
MISISGGMLRQTVEHSLLPFSVTLLSCGGYRPPPHTGEKSWEACDNIFKQGTFRSAARIQFVLSFSRHGDFQRVIWQTSRVGLGPRTLITPTVQVVTIVGVILNRPSS